MEKLDLSKENLKKFGMKTMAIGFLCISLLILIRHRYSILPTTIIAVIFFLTGLTVPMLLKPVYVVWMKLAFILGWVNTRLILCLMFYLVFTPAAILIKLLGKDFLDRRIDKNKASYWKEKVTATFNRLDYERQY